MEGDLPGSNQIVPSQDYGPFDQVLQFSDIARVIVTQEQVPGFLGYFDVLFPIGPAEFFQKMIQKDGDILFPLPQGREEEGDHVQAVVEVLPEAVCLNELLQVLIGSQISRTSTSMVLLPPTRSKALS